MMNLSIKELSDLTGLTSSYISQVERNVIVPSLKSLIKIGEVLKVPIISFFERIKTPKNPVTRKGQRKHITLPNSHIEYELLSPNFNYGIEFLLFTIKPGRSEDEEFVTHFGEEALYLLQGSLKVEIEDEFYILEPGDSIQFHSSRVHRLTNVGDTVVLGIASESPPSF